MKLQFKGLVVTGRSGCPVCGGRQASERSLISVKNFTLPSGRSITVRANKEFEVSDTDGAFLLSYNDRNHIAFTEVQ